MDAHSRCALVGRQIHVKDLLTESYLLPMMSHDPAVRALIEELRKKAPGEVSFSEALERLAAKDLAAMRDLGVAHLDRTPETTG
tara:strand:- start:281 stop:532 length:252 start_codon:yes stop_codon:yes gene_type:complete